jgi:FAD/FMN-containing dehydrogenase
MLNSKIIEQLEKIAGRGNLEARLDGVLVSPEDAGKASEIIRLANEHKLKILPLGESSLLDSSKFTTDNLIIMKTDRLNRLKKVVAGDLYVILEAGHPLKDLNSRLEEFNLFYPLAGPKSVGTIGGSVAVNLKGKSGDKNIQTKEYVLALELIDPQGQILQVGARTFKSVTGYDLPRLYVGSWGTLGFITEISLRLVPTKKRKYYPAFIPDPLPRNKNKYLKSIKSSISSRIKLALDPRQTFFDIASIP